VTPRRRGRARGGRPGPLLRPEPPRRRLRPCPRHPAPPAAPPRRRPGPGVAASGAGGAPGRRSPNHPTGRRRRTGPRGRPRGRRPACPRRRPAPPPPLAPPPGRAAEGSTAQPRSWGGGGGVVSRASGGHSRPRPTKRGGSTEGGSAAASGAARQGRLRVSRPRRLRSGSTARKDETRGRPEFLRELDRVVTEECYRGPDSGLLRGQPLSDDAYDALSTRGCDHPPPQQETRRRREGRAMAGTGGRGARRRGRASPLVSGFRLRRQAAEPLDASRPAAPRS